MKNILLLSVSLISITSSSIGVVSCTETKYNTNNDESHNTNNDESHNTNNDPIQPTMHLRIFNNEDNWWINELIFDKTINISKDSNLYDILKDIKELTISDSNLGHFIESIDGQESIHGPQSHYGISPQVSSSTNDMCKTYQGYICNTGIDLISVQNNDDFNIYMAQFWDGSDPED